MVKNPPTMIALHAATAASRLQALNRKPRAVRRLAVMADADLAAAALATLAAAGYGVSSWPPAAPALRAALVASDGAAVMLNDYATFHATLPAALRDAIAARWGAAERDPLYRPGDVDCGRIMVPAVHYGAVAIVAAPNDESEAPPRHHVLARAAWIADAWRADAVIAHRPLGFDFGLPVLVPAVEDRPDVATLAAALDGDIAALHRWRVT
jgi:cobalamin biosynthesis Mg chelatase CobN